MSRLWNLKRSEWEGEIVSSEWVGNNINASGSESTDSTQGHNKPITAAKLVVHGYLPDPDSFTLHTYCRYGRGVLRITNRRGVGREYIPCYLALLAPTTRSARQHGGRSSPIINTFGSAYRLQ